MEVRDCCHHLKHFQQLQLKVVIHGCSRTTHFIKRISWLTIYKDFSVGSSQCIRRSKTRFIFIKKHVSLKGTRWKVNIDGGAIQKYSQHCDNTASTYWLDLSVFFTFITATIIYSSCQANFIEIVGYISPGGLEPNLLYTYNIHIIPVWRCCKDFRHCDTWFDIKS